MNRQTAVGFWLAITFLGQPVFAQTTKLPTLEQAEKISSQTGRPIFAMAGQGT